MSEITDSSEMLTKLIEDFMEIRRNLMSFSHEKALKAVKNSLTEYRDFKKKITSPSSNEINDQVLQSVFAGFRLLSFVLKIKTGKTNISNVDLENVKGLVIEAFHRKEFLHLFRLAAELLSQTFENLNYLSTARVFIELTVESYNQINLNKKESDDFLDKLDLQMLIPHQVLIGSRLNAELHYLTKLFDASEKKNRAPGNSDKTFDGMLKEMQIADIYEVPKWIKNYKDAKKISNLITLKLNEFQACCDSQCKIVQSLTVTQYLLMIQFWRGYTYHQLSKFQNDKDSKCLLIKESIDHWGPLKQKQMTKQHVVSWSWIETYIYAYRTLMKCSINHLETLVDLKSKSILFAIRSEVTSNIKKIDQLRIDMIQIIEEFIDYMDTRPSEEFEEADKYEYYWQMASHCRAIILDDQAKAYLKKSTPYIKRYVAVLIQNKELRLEASSICEHGVNCQRCKDIMQHDPEEKWLQCAIKRIDSHWFIEKFKKP